MKSTLTTEIDGFTYEVGMFGATQGVGVAAKIGRLLGPGVSGSDGATDQAAMGTAAIAKVLGNLDAPTVQALVKELVSVVSIVGEDGGPVASQFEIHFAGRYAALAKVCAAVVEHNGFFDLLGALGSG